MHSARGVCKQNHESWVMWLCILIESTHQQNPNPDSLLLDCSRLTGLKRSGGSPCSGLSAAVQFPQPTVMFPQRVNHCCHYPLCFVPHKLLRNSTKTSLGQCSSTTIKWNSSHAPRMICTDIRVCSNLPFAMKSNSNSVPNKHKE